MEQITIDFRDTIAKPALPIRVQEWLRAPVAAERSRLTAGLQHVKPAPVPAPPPPQPLAGPDPIECRNLARFDFAALARPAPRATQPAPAPQAATPPIPNDGLKTPAQAARRLGVSTRTLSGLITNGELRYVNVGRGKERERKMFTDSDLDDFIANRTRQKAQQCLSTSPKARRTTTSTSSGEVLAFTARRNGQTGAKRKQ